MKIKPEHYKLLKGWISEFARELPPGKLEEYKESLKNDTRVKDFDVRFAWDLFWSIGSINRQNWVDEVYTYANDNHINTALKKIVKELGL